MRSGVKFGQKAGRKFLGKGRKVPAKGRKLPSTRVFLTFQGRSGRATFKLEDSCALLRHAPADLGRLKETAQA